MDSIIFEDPSKPRIRSKQHARAVPASFVTSLGQECIQEVEPQAVTPVPNTGLHEHSHTCDEGRSEPRSLLDQASKAPLYHLCRSPLHDVNTDDGRILEDISLHDDFSLAQIDENGLGESLDGDLESLFSGVPPDLDFFKTTGSDEHSDGQAQSFPSRSAKTCNVSISSPSGVNLVRSETPGLRTYSDAIDLTVESNCPQPKPTAASSPQQCFPPSSRHKSRIAVEIPTRHPSSATQRNLPPAQSADVMATPKGTRRRTVSPPPDERVKRGRKRRHRSEADFDSSVSRRMRVDVVTNKTPTLVHRTLDEDSASSSRGREVQLHKSGFELGASTGAGVHNSAHGSDSEQTLVDRDADSDYEGMTGPDFTLIEPSPSPATRLKIDKPMDSHGEQKQEQHHDGLRIMSVQPVTATDAAFMTAVIDSPADLQDFFHSPAAWAVECGVHPDNLANIVFKPLTDGCWLLTATISRPASNMDDPRRDRARRRQRWSPDQDISSDFCLSEYQTLSRPTKRGHWTVDEDNNLTEWRRLGKSWSWIFDQFPERSEAAVRSRWFVVLAPPAKSS
ncbi:uncharacterized protein PV06_11747 [Exophiala oligosperma]|uniref:Uncharacterized protein n=2 Tax=Chaetothyriales TaxID=34395 RepID=A0A0D2A6E5_9EURO|nr:uncharacterized protein PV06_11747 [Exophiala oligosperma]KAJ9637122.1 hypothetical protein H2204_005047 [Knufia peltigerae]KIW35921.1 hypothetical protein PV06_11747 [Exophiala oligosperma]